MVKSPLAISLGEEIRLCMREKKVTQRLVAEKISVSVYLLSRMLKGSFLFTGRQIDVIIELLQPDYETSERWRQMCRSLQDGLSNSIQGGNTSLRTLRESRGLTIPLLSNLTGLTTSRLTYLESVGADAPSRGEKELLNQLYTFSDFCRKPGEKSLPLSANEKPLIYLDDLLMLERNIALADLVSVRSRETAFWEISYPEPVYIVLANCSQLQMIFPGFAFLVVAERANSGIHFVELCLDRKDNFFLRERRDGNWCPSKCMRSDASFVSPKWRLPVVDLVIKPFDLTLGVL